MFKLNKEFIQEWKQKDPNFGFNGLGELVFYRTYSRLKEDGTNEDWCDTVERVVNTTYELQRRQIVSQKIKWNADKAQRSAQDMFSRIFEHKFHPPGRGFWAMNLNLLDKVGGAALNNPLHIDTEFFTKDGWKKLSDYSEGDIVEVLSSTKLYGRDHTSSASTPLWVNGRVSKTEIQDCIEIIYEDKYGTQTSTIASKNHRWFRKLNTKTDWERVTSMDLNVGDYLPIVRPRRNFTICKQGQEHGFFFGDGTRSNGELHQFKDSVPVLEKLFSNIDYITDGHAVVRQCPKAWGKLLSNEYLNDNRYLYGFLSGYFAADGFVGQSGSCSISSARYDELAVVKSYFEKLGIRTGNIRVSSTSSNFKDDRELYQLSIVNVDLSEDFFLKEEHLDRWKQYCEKGKRDFAKVVSITEAGEQPVKCLTVDHYEQFVIQGYALTSNCAFVSTDKIGISEEESTKPFEFLFDMSCLGVGVGFDLKGAGKLMITKPTETFEFQIPDSREGWVESLKFLLGSYFSVNGVAPKYAKPVFDYSIIRPAGVPIKTFGGTASGPEPLRILHENVCSVLDKLDGKPITETAIADIMNMIGVAVVAGNVRRTAEIMFGSSEEFLDLKNPTVNPERNDWTTGWGWTSNNSIFAEVGQDYSKVAERTRINGEPGYEWLENARKYGRMSEPINNKDYRAAGGNPCLEQTLESYELCCLVETYPIHHTSLEDYKRTLKSAYLYAKTVTTVPTHNEDTNEVMLRNRRIGLSQSGIAMFIDKYGIHEYKKWCEEGYQTVQYYDEVYSNWFKIPRSIKTSSVKPSGTVSLLAGVTPGMHYPENTHYIRRMRIAANSKLLPAIIASGYKVEPVMNDTLGTTMVVEFPIAIEGVRKLDDVSMWEQVALASFIQKYWADNQVSCTVTFRPEEGKQIEAALNYFQYELKGISFLPKLEMGAYAQMPYESITPEKFEELNANIRKISFNQVSQDSTIERFCDGDACVI